MPLPVQLHNSSVRHQLQLLKEKLISNQTGFFQQTLEKKKKRKMKLCLKGAKQIVQVVDNGRQFLTGDAMKRLAIMEAVEAASGLSIVVDE